MGNDENRNNVNLNGNNEMNLTESDYNKNNDVTNINSSFNSGSQSVVSNGVQNINSLSTATTVGSKCVTGIILKIVIAFVALGIISTAIFFCYRFLSGKKENPTTSLEQVATNKVTESSPSAFFNNEEDGTLELFSNEKYELNILSNDNLNLYVYEVYLDTESKYTYYVVNLKNNSNNIIYQEPNFNLDVTGYYDEQTPLNTSYASDLEKELQYLIAYPGDNYLIIKAEDQVRSLDGLLDRSKESGIQMYYKISSSDKLIKIYKGDFKITKDQINNFDVKCDYKTYIDDNNTYTVGNVDGIDIILYSVIESYTNYNDRLDLRFIGSSKSSLYLGRGFIYDEDGNKINISHDEGDLYGTQVKMMQTSTLKLSTTKGEEGGVNSIVSTYAGISDAVDSLNNVALSYLRSVSIGDNYKNIDAMDLVVYDGHLSYQKTLDTTKIKKVFRISGLQSGKLVTTDVTSEVSYPYLPYLQCYAQFKNDAFCDFN